MGKPTYFEMLKDPQWQRRKTEIQIRDNFTCRRCTATTKELHVHHQFYESGKLPWEYTDEQLILLCADCHDRATTFMTLMRRSLSQLHPAQQERVLGYIDALLAVTTERSLFVWVEESQFVVGASDMLFSLGHRPLLEALKATPTNPDGGCHVDAAAMRDRFRAENKAYRSDD